MEIRNSSDQNPKEGRVDRIKADLQGTKYGNFTVIDTVKDWRRTTGLDVHFNGEKAFHAVKEGQEVKEPKKVVVEVRDESTIPAAIKNNLESTDPLIIDYITRYAHQNGFLQVSETITKTLVNDKGYMLACEKHRFDFIENGDGSVTFIERFYIESYKAYLGKDYSVKKSNQEDRPIAIFVTVSNIRNVEGEIQHQLVSDTILLVDELGKNLVDENYGEIEEKYQSTVEDIEGKLNQDINLYIIKVINDINALEYKIKQNTSYSTEQERLKDIKQLDAFLQFIVNRFKSLHLKEASDTVKTWPLSAEKTAGELLLDKSKEITEYHPVTPILDIDITIFHKTAQINQLISDIADEIKKEKFKIKHLEVEISKLNTFIQHIKKNEKIAELIKYKTDSINRKKELIELYQNNITQLHTSLGKFNQYLYIDRPASSTNSDDKNLLMLLKEFFPDSESIKEAQTLHLFINTASLSIANEEIYKVLQDKDSQYHDKIKAANRILKRSYKRAQIAEMEFKIRLICNLQEFAKGHWTTFTLINSLEKLAKDYPNHVNEINNINAKLKNIYVDNETKHFQYPKSIEPLKVFQDLETVVYSIYQTLFKKQSLEQVYKKLFNEKLPDIDFKADKQAACEEIKLKTKVCMQKLLNDLHSAYTSKARPNPSFRQLWTMLDELINAIKEEENNGTFEIDGKFKQMIFDMFKSHAQKYENEGAYIQLIMHKLTTMRELNVIPKDKELLKPAQLFNKQQEENKTKEEQVWVDLCHYAKSQLNSYSHPFKSKERRTALRKLNTAIDELNKSGVNPSDKIKNLIKHINETSKEIMDMDYVHDQKIGKYSLFSYRNEQGSNFQKTLTRIRDKAVSCLILEDTQHNELATNEIAYIKLSIEQLKKFASLRKLCDRKEIKNFLDEFNEKEPKGDLQKWLDAIVIVDNEVLSLEQIAIYKKNIQLIYERLQKYTTDFSTLKSRIYGNFESTKAFIHNFNEVQAKLDKFITTQAQMERFQAPSNDHVFSKTEQNLRAEVRKALYLVLLDVNVSQKNMALLKYKEVVKDNDNDSDHYVNRVRIALSEIERSMKKLFPGCQNISFQGTGYKEDSKQLEIKISWKTKENEEKTTSFTIEQFHKDTKDKMICSWATITDKPIDNKPGNEVLLVMDL